MKTESDKDRRRIKHRNERKLYTSTLNLNPKFMVRCSTCGGICKMPCLLCQVRGVK